MVTLLLWNDNFKRQSHFFLKTSKFKWTNCVLAWVKFCFCYEYLLRIFSLWRVQLDQIQFKKVLWSIPVDKMQRNYCKNHSKLTHVTVTQLKHKCVIRPIRVFECRSSKYIFRSFKSTIVFWLRDFDTNLGTRVKERSHRVFGTTLVFIIQNM